MELRATERPEDQKRVRLTANATVVLEKKTYEARCMYGGMDHSQPLGVAVTQGNCGTAGSLYCIYSSKLLCRSKHLLLLSDFNTVKSVILIFWILKCFGVFLPLLLFSFFKGLYKSL